MVTIRTLRLFVAVLVSAPPLPTKALCLPFAATTIRMTSNAQTPQSAPYPSATDPILATDMYIRTPIVTAAAALSIADEAITGISSVLSSSTSSPLSASTSASYTNTTLPRGASAMLPHSDIASMTTATSSTLATLAVTTAASASTTNTSTTRNANSAGPAPSTVTPTPTQAAAGLASFQPSDADAAALRAHNIPPAVGSGIGNTDAASARPGATRRTSVHPATTAFFALVKPSDITFRCDHGASVIFVAPTSTSAPTTTSITAGDSDIGPLSSTAAPPAPPQRAASLASLQVGHPQPPAAAASSASAPRATEPAGFELSDATLAQAETRNLYLVFTSGIGDTSAAGARTGPARRLCAQSGAGPIFVPSEASDMAGVPKNLTVLPDAGGSSEGAGAGRAPAPAHAPIFPPLATTNATNATTVEKPDGTVEYMGKGLSSTTIFGIVFGLCLLVAVHTALCCLWSRCHKKTTSTRTPAGGRSSSASSPCPCSRVDCPAAGVRRTSSARDPSATALTLDVMIPTGSGARHASK